MRTSIGRPGLIGGGLAGGVVCASVTIALVLLGVNGQLAVITPAEFDPGALVRLGLPAARSIHDVAAAATIGLLAIGTWCVPPEPGSRGGSLAGPRRFLVRAAAAAGLGWLGSGIAVLLLTADDVSGFRVGTAGFGRVLTSFVTQIDLGRALGVSVLLVAVVAVLTAVATRVVTAAWASALSLVALLPIALAGHAATSTDHANSVDSLALHLISATLWVGGLGATLLVARRLDAELTAVVRRYSTLAGVCFVVVAASGIVNAILRLGSLANLGTAYGVLVVAKVVALTLLGVAGLLHRRMTIDRLAGDRRLFARLAAVELLIMGATFGLAVALSRSAPPTSLAETDPIAVLLGYPAPPPLTVGRYFTAFYPETLWLAVAAALLGLYVAGTLRLHHRGDHWPVQRTLFWVAGCLTLVFVTSGGPAVYGRIHFRTHMLQHMTLMVIVPLLLVFGAPVALAMRALTPRADGSFGPREVLLQLVHSRFLRLLGQPVVAAVLFTGSLTVFYYSPLFDLSMFTHTGHVLMTAHFIGSGYLFVWALVGLDPGPARPPYPLRLVLLLMTLGFHAFFGISLMASNTVLAPDWWHSLGQFDEASLLSDQQTGGSIAWAAGDITSLLLAVALLVSWVRSDAQETRRLDRKADRDHDADLRRYNEQLASMARPRPRP